ncbi:AAA family ATPase [Cupriavidus campinensis]|uniref:AAA family ATPase n=1 Tax=Cupriavidus campinensis TaxID=151783 RepID=UPI00164268EC|nr:AAA family ATPase [Cupriavidus campinensis]
MNIERLTIKNFLTIEDAELELDNRGLLLIQGENKANPSATSNGAGKSSLVDALCWGLYGETARGETGDAVVNEVAKKNCSVATVVRDDDMEYRIVRYRKNAKLKNHLTVSQRDASGIGTDLTKGTDKETQEVVNRIMGCSLDVFVAAIYAGQEKMPDLPGMTDKQLKVLIEEAAGVEVLETAYRIARDRLTAAEKAAAITEARVVALNEKIKGDKITLLDIKSKAFDFDDGRKARASAELANLPRLTLAMHDLQDKAATVPVPALTKERAELEAKLSSFGEIQKKVEAVFEDRNAKSSAHARIKMRLENAVTLAKQAKQALDDVAKTVGTACGECGKTYCEHDLEAATVARQTKLTEALTALKTAKAEEEGAAKLLKEAAEAAVAARATLPDVSEIDKRKREVDAALSALTAINADIARHERAIEDAKTAARGKLAEANPYSGQLTLIQGQIDRAELELVTAQTDLDVQTKECAILADAAKVFSPAGVRAHILDTVTPYLNERTSEYLGVLTDGDTQAVWSTLQAGTKGALKEKFNIAVQSASGGGSFGLLSGGEKRKVRLACAMALQDMVASRATKPVNIFVADEIDHALDEAGLERLMAILNTKAKERGTVLVVSHQSLADWIDSVITVTKTAKGKSQVSGETRKVM